MFGTAAFRQLAGTAGQPPVHGGLTKDKEAERLTEQLQAAERVIAELEMAEQVLKWVMEKKEDEEELPTGEASDIEMDGTS